MKKGIHPDYHLINVMMTNGETFQTKSTWGKEGDTLHLEIDPLTHVAWTKKEYLIEKGELAKFNQRFKGLGKL
jgi:large subunit ribosomal protein L31